MMKRAIFIILVFAFIVRMISLDQSLWLDEATTARVVSSYRLTEIIDSFSIHDFHPPLYYYVMKLWTDVFGYSEISLRMPSVLFSLGTGYLVFLMGGVWAAFLFLFNPLTVYYSQEARMYMMATFWLTLTFFFFERTLKKERIKDAVLLSVFSSLAFFSFYGSIFFIISVFIFILLKKKYKALVYGGIIFSISVLLISPLLFKQFALSRIILDQVSNWSLSLGKVTVRNLALFPIKFFFGRISFFPKWLYYLVSSFWVFFAFPEIGNILKKNNIHRVFVVFSTIGLGIAFSLFSPLLQYFRFQYLLPVIFLFYHDNMKTRTVAVGFFLLSLFYLLLPGFHREDWKGLVGSLSVREPVHMVFSSSDPVGYYNPEIKIIDIREIGTDRKKITVIPYSTDIHGIDYKSQLEKKGFERSVKSFRGLFLETWSMKD